MAYATIFSRCLITAALVFPAIPAGGPWDKVPQEWSLCAPTTSLITSSSSRAARRRAFCGTPARICTTQYFLNLTPGRQWTWQMYGSWTRTLTKTRAQNFISRGRLTDTRHSIRIPNVSSFTARRRQRILVQAAGTHCPFAPNSSPEPCALTAGPTFSHRKLQASGGASVRGESNLSHVTQLPACESNACWE